MNFPALQHDLPTNEPQCRAFEKTADRMVFLLILAQSTRKRQHGLKVDEENLAGLQVLGAEDTHSEACQMDLSIAAHENPASLQNVDRNPCSFYQIYRLWNSCPVFLAVEIRGYEVHLVEMDRERVQRRRRTHGETRYLHLFVAHGYHQNEEDTFDVPQSLKTCVVKEHFGS